MPGCPILWNLHFIDVPSYWIFLNWINVGPPAPDCTCSCLLSYPISWMPHLMAPPFHRCSILLNPFKLNQYKTLDLPHLIAYLHAHYLIPSCGCPILWHLHFIDVPSYWILLNWINIKHQTSHTWLHMLMHTILFHLMDAPSHESSIS